MTKELSKQLCELCGITRKYCKKCGSRGYIGERYLKEDIFECCICHCEDYEIKANSDINFAEPENFVKLIELKPRKTHKPLFGEVTALTYFFNKSAFVLDCRKDFLKMLINTINGYSDDFIRKSSQAKIKQSIREAEWKYE